MNVVIPDEIVQSMHLSPADLQVQIAVMLFESERITLGQAARLAALPQATFMKILGERRIALHYGVDDFEQDLRTLEAGRQSSP